MVTRTRLNVMLHVHCLSSFPNHCCNMTPQPNSNITHLEILGPVAKGICHSLPICSVTQQSTHFVKSSQKLGQDNFHIRTMHRAIIKIHYSPTNAQVIVLKTILTFRRRNFLLNFSTSCI
jgi:hypothetical protein